MGDAMIVATLILLTINTVIGTLSFIFTHVRCDDDKK